MRIGGMKMRLSSEMKTPPLLSSLLLAIAVTAFAMPASASVLVLEGGTVHPVSGPAFVGHVVIEHGRIVAAGSDAAPPAGAERLDVTGLHVYPGLFDTLTTLGLVEINSLGDTVDTTELGEFNAHLMAAQAIHPASEVIGVTRANGTTHVIAAPQTDGVIAGQAALIHLDGWTVEEMAIDPAVAMVVEWPEIQTRSFDFATFSIKETPFNDAKEKAEEKQEELRDWLDAARHYAQAASAEGGRAERDLKLEALARVLAGDQQVLVLAQRKRDLEAAIEFAEKEGLEIILAGARDAWKIKDLLAEKDVPVILGLVQSLPAEEDDPYDTPFRTAGELTGAGVRVAFATGAGGGFGPGGPHGARNLPYEVATAMANGLSEEEALKALTLWPAEIFGVADHLGSIAPGKIANLIVTDGSPLEITTQVRHLIISGQEVTTDNRHRRLYKKHRARPLP